MPDDVTDRLAALERRLDRLEALLDATARSPAAPPRVLPPPFNALATEPAAKPLGSVPLQVRGTLEQAIGLRWAGWVGAIVLVIGAGLGIDFAYRQGWFAIVSPAVRVAGLVAIGAALIACGEVVHRRVNVRSAVGLFAAGVAVLFLAAYAGHAFYGLYGRGVAFALMAAATVVGAAVARRGDLVSIAALSIVGGNLAPVLLRAGEPRPAGFLAYLLTLEVVAVALAWRGGRKWWTLRGLSLATTAGWVASVLGSPTFAGATTVAFVVAYAVLYHGEQVASAVSVDEPAAAGSVPFGVCVTAALAAAVLYLTRDDTAPFRTAEVLGMAAVAGGAAAACARVRRGGLRAVAVGFLIQAVGLVVLAVPVAASGASVALGWGVMAVALAVAGRWSRAAAYAAPVVWSLAAFDLLLWADGWVGEGHAADPWLAIAGQPIQAFVVTAVLLTAAGHVVAALTRRRAVEEGGEIAVVVDGAAAVCLVAATVLGLPPLWATGAGLVYAGIARVPPAMPVAVPIAAAVFFAVKWMASDTVLRRPPSGLTWAAAGVGVGVVAVLVGILRGRRVSDLKARRALRVFTVVAGVWAASALVDATFAQGRHGLPDAPGLAEQVALSVLWAASATAVVVAGFGRRLPDLRYTGLAVFAITLVKVVAVDLSGVGAGYRTLSFLGLGGLLLATSVLYGRLGATPADRPARP